MTQSRHLLTPLPLLAQVGGAKKAQRPGRTSNLFERR